MSAGYSVVAIDAFSDSQTAELAERAFIVKYDDIGFDAEDLLRTLRGLDNPSLEGSGFCLNQFAGFVYGSGFEAQPDLLQKVAALITVIGNDSTTLSAVKDANVFFPAMESLNISYPETSKHLPADADLSCYIRKFSGGSGGVHIQPASLIQGRDLEHHYFQRKLAGVPVSLLFIANSNDVEVVGFNEQWVSASARLPFRYGGAVSHAILPVVVQEQLIAAARQLTMTFGLLGLNSLDAIVHSVDSDVGSVQVSILEINPRLSATVDLYDDRTDLFERHVQASMHKHLFGKHPKQCEFESVSKAHAVVYAEVDVTLEKEIVWPSWATDTPSMKNEPLKIVAGAPVCSVLASARNAVIAKKEVLTRVQQIKKLLESTH